MESSCLSMIDFSWAHEAKMLDMEISWLEMRKINPRLVRFVLIWPMPTCQPSAAMFTRAYRHIWPIDRDAILKDDSLIKRVLASTGLSFAMRENCLSVALCRFLSLALIPSIQGKYCLRSCLNGLKKKLI